MGNWFPGLAGTRYPTRAQVQNLLEITAQKAVSEALALAIQELDDDTVVALGLKADDADFQAHVTDLANPHVVTKTQVGLSNVDNTSDLDKPISTAVQGALNNKQDAGDPVLGTVQSLTGDGAANLTSIATALTTNAATQAVTLANGASGQFKVITLVAQGDPADVATITPATALGFTSVALDAPGESVTLLWSGGWIVVATNGASVT